MISARRSAAVDEDHSPAMTVLPVLALEDDAQQEALDLRGTFTTMTRDDTARWPMFQLALLAADQGDDRIIVGLGTVTRSYRRVATGWHRLRYTSRAEIEPIAGGALMEAVPKRFRATLADRLASGGRLSDKAAAATVIGLAQINPDAGRELRRLLSGGSPASRGCAARRSRRRRRRPTRSGWRSTSRTSRAARCKGSATMASCLSWRGWKRSAPARMQRSPTTACASSTSRASTIPPASCSSDAATSD